TSLSDPIAQRTVLFNNNYCTLTLDGSGNTCISKTEHPAENGTPVATSLPFIPRVETFTATNSALFILDNDGKLYTSTNGSSWSSTGQTWQSITAPYGDTLTGIAETNGTLFHVTYPASTTSPVKDDFPVSGNSQAIQYASDWGQQPQIITVGGLRADGIPTPSVWAYDGNTWICINKATPMAAEGITIAPYYCCQTDTNTWIATTRSVLLAMGGRMKDGKIIESNYISYDLGFHWEEAPKVMQPSALFPALSDAQAFIVNHEFNSRAVRPITEWDTPFIYLYGGNKVNRTLSPTIYRGVIKRLEFKPLQ
ncbi:MAG: hypothetical protein K2G40_00910, partial [Muribaculaceae bacterium]|nr:hypothetical protein [Muribaculaceae bacterium]